MTNNKEFSVTFLVDKTPQEVFDAINNPRGWWSQEIVGDTTTLGSVFVYHFQVVHRATLKITEFVPGKKVVWHVLDSKLSFTKAKNEWNDTNITFEISKKGDKTEVNFSHLGLVPSFECYGNCSSAWDALVAGNLHQLIVTGEAQPSPW